jgi:hypothetical protein
MDNGSTPFHDTELLTCQSNTDFSHPYDTPVSSSLRFLTELIAWVAGPWAIGTMSAWLVVPALALLVGLPSIFSTRNDKRQVIVSTPGPARVGLELVLYVVAAVAPWFVWPAAVAWVALGIVVASLVAGMPRIMWLLKGAPAEGDNRA